MERKSFIQPPIPYQGELLTVNEEVARREYQRACINDHAHLPETSIRYLIWLVASGAPHSEIHEFCNQVRIELNNQHNERLREKFSFCVDEGARRYG